MIAEINGAAVRVARAIKNLSQAQLAKKSGLQQTKIFQIENDLAQPKPEEWARIWSALTSE